MANQTKIMQKRKNAIPIDDEIKHGKRFKAGANDEQSSSNSSQVRTLGKIKKIVLRNFLSHDHLIMDFNPNVNFIVGKNGSGKSAILTAITIGLGGRATVTQRGDSYKSFIKNGKSSTTIEITLSNEGLKAYEPEIYGNIIKIIRTISHSTSTLVIKGQGDTVLSKKKIDLEKITSALNIQVANPISVLNQNCSKTFLVNATSSSLYSFFMQATQLDTIGNNYKEALEVSRVTQEKIKQTEEQLQNDKKEIDEIELSLEAIEGLERIRQEYDALQCEYLWARVVNQEKIVTTTKEAFKQQGEIAMNIEKEKQNHEERIKKIIGEITCLSERIQELQQEAQESCHNQVEKINKQHLEKKRQFDDKVQQYRDSKIAIKQWQRNMNTLSDEIRRLEELDETSHRDRAQLKESNERLQKELREIRSMIETTQIDQAHFDSNKSQLEKEKAEARVEYNYKERKLRDLRGQLDNLHQQGDNSLTVFGRHIPRLLKRIEEEYKKGRFAQKPRGPIGGFIKMKDKQWTPAIESFLGTIMSAFCVDNSRDASLLKMLIQEVYNGDRGPDIICSKFIQRVHDVRANSTRTAKFSNILDVMEISDSVIANCLIDQRSPETILLIDTNDEAVALLQNVENVPQNCKRALTKRGDTYYPDPNFRTYGGSVNPNPRFLQVSTTQLIQGLKQEISIIEAELIEAKNKFIAAESKHSNSLQNGKGLMLKLNGLRKLETEVKNKIEDLKDKMNDEADTDANRLHYIEQKDEFVKKIDEEKIINQQFANEVNFLQQELKDIEIELARARQLSTEVDEKINPIKKQVNKLEEEKNRFELNYRKIEKKLIEAHHGVQQATSNVEIQNRVMETLLNEAEQSCSRIQTDRSPDNLKKLANEKKNRIQMVEKKYGSKEDLENQLKNKKNKYESSEQVLSALNITNTEHLTRVQNRRKQYKDMKIDMAGRVRDAFSQVLALRDYEGSLKVDYDNKQLLLDVVPQNTERREKNQTNALSGGERSYATVALLIALWECTSFPFYFLDEFDVFMDKVNRRMIMELLLNHTKHHPETQFGFLTPLDASIVKSDDFLTIHQLEAPHRESNQNA